MPKSIPSAARKRRRQRRPNVPPYTGPIQPSSAEITAEEERPRSRAGTAVSVSTASGGPVDFAAEYRYVIRDLRNMFIVAGAMLVLLFVLNLVLT
jgi:hypothetical protein